MQFDLNETQTLLKNSARDFLATECPMPEVRRLIETGTAYDAALWKKFAEQGWTGIVLGEEWGGAGMGMVEAAVVMEEMGKALVPGPYLATVLLAGTLIDSAGTPEHKQNYLRSISSGAARASVALLEAGASWDVDAVALPAVTMGNCHRLNGTKLFVQDAGVADYLVVAGRLGDELALWIVETDRTGVSMKPMPALDLTRRIYQVGLHEVDVPAPQLLATGAAARASLARALDVAAACLAAEMTGGMQRVLDITLQYAKTRKQFGAPIGQFQAVQHLCADMFLLVECSRAAAYHAAYQLQDNAPGAALAVSAAKSYVSEAYREVGNRGIQVHGGMGFTWENDLHLYYRRAKASEILFGDAVFHRERIASVLDGARRPGVQ